MTITIAVTNRINEMVEKRWSEMSRQVGGGVSKEGFVNALLLLALTDEDISQQAAYLNRHYFDGKGATALENKEKA